VPREIYREQGASIAGGKLPHMSYIQAYDLLTQRSYDISVASLSTCQPVL
jgi:hypothetical protein